jgi:hypothetical protein
MRNVFNVGTFMSKILLYISIKKYSLFSFLTSSLVDWNIKKSEK